jgi:acetyl esterase/lipase
MKIETITLPDGNHARLTAYIYDTPGKYHAGYRSPPIVFCPGGGFSHLSPREGEPIALRFAAEGYSAFVLEYPVGDKGAEHPKALKALAEGIRHVRALHS